MYEANRIARVIHVRAGGAFERVKHNKGIWKVTKAVGLVAGLSYPQNLAEYTELRLNLVRHLVRGPRVFSSSKFG